MILLKGGYYRDEPINYDVLNANCIYFAILSKMLSANNDIRAAIRDSILIESIDLIYEQIDCVKHVCATLPGYG